MSHLKWYKNIVLLLKFSSMLESLKNVGCHTKKLKTVLESVKAFVRFTSQDGQFQVPPCQIFLGEPRSGRHGKISDDDIQNSAELIKNFEIPFFVHAAYCINLCNVEVDGSDTVPWCVKLLKEDLVLCQRLGGRGVVVHVGKRKTLSVVSGLDKMFTSLKSALQFASPDCPILLETPAGQGTELCVKVDEFVEFYDRFSENEKKLIKICIDTQHVFSGDHEPLEYIQKFVDQCGISSLRLIHLNDSLVQKGAHKDRHKQLGTGYIGKEKLIEIINWATLHEIPMVVE